MPYTNMHYGHGLMPLMHHALKEHTDIFARHGHTDAHRRLTPAMRRRLLWQHLMRGDRLPPENFGETQAPVGPSNKEREAKPRMHG